MQSWVFFVQYSHRTHSTCEHVTYYLLIAIQVPSSANKLVLLSRLMVNKLAHIWLNKVVWNLLTLSNLANMFWQQHNDKIHIPFQTIQIYFIPKLHNFCCRPSSIRCSLELELCVLDEDLSLGIFPFKKKKVKCNSSAMLGAMFTKCSNFKFIIFVMLKLKKIQVDLPYFDK